MESFFMDQRSDNYIPLFHGRLIMFVFTLFMGSFFGAILYSQNLKEIGKKNLITPLIIISLLYNFLTLRLLSLVGIDSSSLKLILPNFVAAIILAGFGWSQHFNGVKPYHSRNILWPVLTIVLVYGFFITMNIILPGRTVR